MSQLTIQSNKSTVHTFTESLSPGVDLELALILGGSFEMGSPENEEYRQDDESLHTVTVPTFFMARTPVTQAQWRSIVKRPKIKTDLEANPSKFKSNEDLPVDYITWDHATEFCLRLSKKTGRTYRLPSEAEWEYACRAGTKTPFCFGETIDTNLANYDGGYIYEQGVNGLYREEKTLVKTFPPNQWGLYDMHGNVWEWCQDDYEGDYHRCPSDGRFYLTKFRKGDPSKILRGGSWMDSPESCRSAYRNPLTGIAYDSYIGFRVVCAASRSLP
jgi:formylglycine-generating enzyme required for sulfatase activity